MVLALLGSAYALRDPTPYVSSLHQASLAAPIAEGITPAQPSPRFIESKPTNARKQRKDTMISLLGAMSGFSGVLCFRRFGCYANMMTGNFARLAHALAAARWWDAVFYTALALSYAVGVCIYRFLVILHQRHEKADSFPMTIAPAALLAFVLADVVDQSALPVRCMIPFLSVGFGIINAASMNSIGAITNAATGHLTRVGVGAVDAMLLGAPLQKSAGSARYLVSFFVSVIVTSILYNVLQGSQLTWFPPMGSSIGVLYTLLVLWYCGATHPARDRFRVFLYACLQRR